MKGKCYECDFISNKIWRRGVVYLKIHVRSGCIHDFSLKHVIFQKRQNEQKNN